MDCFDACTYKFSPIKYRGDYTPKAKGRQAHCAVALDKFTMVILGGSFSDNLIDPTPVSPEDSVLSHDMEANTWRLLSKTCNSASEPIPWNLVFHSAFKLDH
jgi:hypothetical protein